MLKQPIEKSNCKDVTVDANGRCGFCGLKPKAKKKYCCQWGNFGDGHRCAKEPPHTPVVEKKPCCDLKYPHSSNGCRTSSPVVEGWEEKLRKGLLNQSCDRSGDGMTAYYRIGQTSTFDWFKDFISQLLTSVRSEERQKYNELIMAVSMKHQGETRHETALRYIRHMENQNGNGNSEAKQN